MTASINRSRYDEVIPIRLMVTATVMEECARLLLSEGHFINLTEMRILGYLTERSEASISEIGRDLQVDKAWVSRLLKQLSQRRFIHRLKHPSDSRLVMISITAEGRDFFDAAFEEVTPYQDAILAGIDEDVLTQMLNRLESNVRAINARLR